MIITKYPKIFLKELTITLIFSLGLILPTNATNVNDELSTMEMYYFHHCYRKNPTIERVDRLEKMVFGSTDDTDGIDKRIQNLNGVFAATQSSPSNNTPTNSVPSPDTYSNQEDKSPNNLQKESPSQGRLPANNLNQINHSNHYLPTAPQETAQHNNFNKSNALPKNDYPIVSTMEMKVFNQTYQDEPIKERLDRLELKLYGTKSTLPDLSERVDNLMSTMDLNKPKSKVAKKHSDWMSEDELEAQNASLGNNAVDQAYSQQANMGMGGSNMGMGSSNMGMGGSNMGMGGSNMGMGGSNMGMGGSNMGMGGSNMGMGGSNFNSNFLNSDNFFGSDKPKNPKKLAKYDMQKYGINQCVTRLEQEILGKTNQNQPLETRVAKLENIIFPDGKNPKKTNVGKRVEKLLAVVPIDKSNKTNNNNFPNFNPNNPNQDMSLNSLGNNVQMPMQPSSGMSYNSSFSNPLSSMQYSGSSYGFGGMGTGMGLGGMGMGLGGMGMGLGGMGMGYNGMGMGYNGMGTGLGGMGMGYNGMGMGYNGMGMGYNGMGMGLGGMGMGGGGFNSGFSPFGSGYGFSSGIGRTGLGAGLIYP